MYLGIIYIYIITEVKQLQLAAVFYTLAYYLPSPIYLLFIMKEINSIQKCHFQNIPNLKKQDTYHHKVNTYKFKK